MKKKRPKSTKVKTVNIMSNEGSANFLPWVNFVLTFLPAIDLLHLIILPKVKTENTLDTVCKSFCKNITVSKFPA
jgi:hypothetical protein